MYIVDDNHRCYSSVKRGDINVADIHRRRVSRFQKGGQKREKAFAEHKRVVTLTFEQF